MQKNELEELSGSELTEENLARDKELIDKIGKILLQEEIHCAQRSRVNCLWFGDKKTLLFHKFCSTRRFRNMIKCFCDDNDNGLEASDYLNPMISQLFAGLFTTEVDELDPNLINKVSPLVKNEMNNGLLKPYIA
jgi:hypothetical protein